MGWAGIGAENRAREDLYLILKRCDTYARTDSGASGNRNITAQI